MFFCLFVCLFVCFFYRDKQNIFLKSMASLIPADTRLSYLKRKKKTFFGLSEIHISIEKIRVDWASPSLSKVWRNLCQKVVLPSSIRPRSFLPEINSSNKEIKKAVAFFRIVHLLVISWKCYFRTCFFFTNLYYCSINLQLNWKQFSKNFCSPW